MNENSEIVAENTTTETKEKTYRLKTINGKELMERELPPLRYTIEEILPHGFFILAGGAKVGKSWLAEQISYAVASGGKLWSYQAVQGEVLYFGLEDTELRLQSRFEKYNAYEGMENIHFVLSANNVQTGINDDIREYLNDHPNIKLVIVDTLQHIRGNEFVKNIYAGDVEFTDILRRIAYDYDITLLALTHTNKGKYDDEVSKISGSEGIAGGTDGNWVLTKNKRTDTKASLIISNRDTEAFEFAIEFDKESCIWQKIDREDAPKTDKEVILFSLVAFLKEADSHHWEGTATELHENLLKKDSSLMGVTVASFSKMLGSMGDALHQFYGITMTKSYHNKQKWIVLDYVELR